MSTPGSGEVKSVPAEVRQDGRIGGTRAGELLWQSHTRRREVLTLSHGDKSVLMPTEVSSRVGFFDRFAGWAALLASRATFFAFCVLLIVLWAPSILVLHKVDTWQLIINTATTIITFLMVALL